MHRVPAQPALTSSDLALTIDRARMAQDQNPPLAPGIPPDAPARRRVDHCHCARLRPGTKAPVGSVPPDGVAVALSATPERVARHQLGPTRSGSPPGSHAAFDSGQRVAPPVLPLCRAARLGPKTHTEAMARRCRRRLQMLQELGLAQISIARPSARRRTSLRPRRTLYMPSTRRSWWQATTSSLLA